MDALWKITFSDNLEREHAFQIRTDCDDIIMKQREYRVIEERRKLLVETGDRS
ncbi:Hypothetical predicted protein [Pelobates cultripes]|uniref:Uncharacterized protein n=1 Tax=Pelobates cultripes TaxID=61616 RepID=A0AAD1RFR4_PELCU|nr:Hypothetical predicted protein [Pelobates cultripes]